MSDKTSRAIRPGSCTLEHRRHAALARELPGRCAPGKGVEARRGPRQGTSG